jgi:hypothetical protein
MGAINPRDPFRLEFGTETFEYYERMRRALQAMDGWPFRSDQLTLTTERCSCGAFRAALTIGEWTLTACRAMLMGEAEGGPEAHVYGPQPPKLPHLPSMTLEFKSKTL